MNKNWKSGAQMNWRTALAKMGVKPTVKAKMIFEIDGSNGEKLVFPEAADITEIKEESTVTAEDGEHVFVTDGNTYKIEVLAGKVVTLEVTPVEGEEPTEMSAETVQMLQAIADQFDANEVSFAELKSEIATMKSEKESLKTQLSEMKALMNHGGDGGEGGEGGEPKPKAFSVNGKKIDLTKINLK